MHYGSICNQTNKECSTTPQIRTSPVKTATILAQSAGAVEYTNCTSAEGVKPSSNECPGNDTKQSDGKVPVMLGVWEYTKCVPLLPSFLDPLWPRVVAAHKGPIYGSNRTKPWFRDLYFFVFKLRIYAKLNCLEYNCFDI